MGAVVVEMAEVEKELHGTQLFPLVVQKQMVDLSASFLTDDHTGSRGVDV